MEHNIVDERKNLSTIKDSGAGVMDDMQLHNLCANIKRKAKVRVWIDSGYYILATLYKGQQDWPLGMGFCM